MSSNNFLVLREYYSLNISAFQPHHQRAREDGTRPNTSNNTDSFSLEDSTMVPSSFEVPCCSTFTPAKKSKPLIYPENKNDPTNVEGTATKMIPPMWKGLQLITWHLSGKTFLTTTFQNVKNLIIQSWRTSTQAKYKLAQEKWH